MNLAKKFVPKQFNGKESGVLSGTLDRYKGITITNDISEFVCKDKWNQTLAKSIETYKKEGFRAIWLQIPHQNLHLAAEATANHNFKMHHAKCDYLMLNKWIDPSSESRLPDFATHYVGVGGVVLNREKTKMLCIQERVSVVRDNIWKLPGGLVETGESIEQASIREVWEETGVKAEFKAVLGFRELLKY